MNRVGPRTVLVFQVLAYVTGVLLLFNVFVASPLKYAGGRDLPAEIGWQVHGYVYIAYFAVTLYLAYHLRWSWVRAVLVLLAGTLPFASFVAERRVVRELRRDSAESPTPVGR